MFNIKIKSILFLLTISSFVLVNFVFASSSSVNVGQSVISEGGGEEGGDSEGGGAVIFPINATPPYVFDVKIYDVTKNSAKIEWKTDDVCLSELYYGENYEYDYGPLYDHQDSYENLHSFYLSNLFSNTKYYLKIKSKNQKGAERILTSYGFITSPEGIPVPNIYDLDIRQTIEGVAISWKNPSEKNFKGLQIYKSENSYKSYPGEDDVIFDSDSEYFLDRNVESSKRYYYSFFSYDSEENFSSGVFASIYINYSGEEEPPDNSSIPKDVEDFKIVSDVENGKNILTWKNPDEENIFEVEIFRDKNFPPLTPYEGDLVYKGKGNIFEDGGMNIGDAYYYSAFVKNSNGIYSEGKFLFSVFAGEAEYDFNAEWEKVRFIDSLSGISLKQNNQKVTDFSGSFVSVVYDSKILPEEIKMMALKIDESLYFLDFDENDGFYKTNIHFPDELGESYVEFIFLNFNDDIIFRKKMGLISQKKGFVYEFANSGSLFNVKNLICLVENIIFNKENEECLAISPVEGVSMSVFYKEEDLGTWNLWKAEDFGQNNPYFSNERGEFGFLVPDGYYKIELQKNGFYEKNIELQSVDNIIKNDIKIIRRKYIFYGIILPVILFILFVVGMLKKLLNKRKK